MGKVVSLDEYRKKKQQDCLDAASLILQELDCDGFEDGDIPAEEDSPETG